MRTQICAAGANLVRLPYQRPASSDCLAVLALSFRSGGAIAQASAGKAGKHACPGGESLCRNGAKHVRPCLHRPPQPCRRPDLQRCGSRPHRPSPDQDSGPRARTAAASWTLPALQCSTPTPGTAAMVGSSPKPASPSKPSTPPWSASGRQHAVRRLLLPRHGPRLPPAKRRRARRKRCPAPLHSATGTQPSPKQHGGSL